MNILARLLPVERRFTSGGSLTNGQQFANFLRLLAFTHASGDSL
jgi:hypothetical protein